ncbi:site-specific DNA-methyltransferase (adenine-specific) [Izhakiella capsodis]|uniref:Methyltransferase n=1 Tax=Izhakiella capsodis TaxID=1367852 RepID=A0A1I4ZK97_9GAMM|nr:DNA methyltransferase [Izhakiella capsodis]SFN50701.1 site-specific DNA-methyltransferase (adenine-specific) [Izhakiella capsodis]
MAYAAGIVRDAIIDFLTQHQREASTSEITHAVSRLIGPVASSSVRSYLNLNTPGLFTRVARGHYRLTLTGETALSGDFALAHAGDARLIHADCFDWLAQQQENRFQAVVTDPPYSLLEYSPTHTAKLRAGKGGIWRLPPSFDGRQRAPLPRFTVLNAADRENLWLFFARLAHSLHRVIVPGANVVVASNPLLCHLVASAMSSSGLELRGYLVRQVMTMRGGDRPKNAHNEFNMVSVMPRSQWEPWVLLRKPLEGRAQDNLRRWHTGGFRRPATDKPFGDLIRSHPTPAGEKRIAPHPSLKPQGFMRQLVRAVLPLAQGEVLDPFMGAGSTLAAANAVGYRSVGVEIDADFYQMAKQSVQRLSALKLKNE